MKVIFLVAGGYVHKKKRRSKNELALRGSYHLYNCQKVNHPRFNESAPDTTRSHHDHVPPSVSLSFSHTQDTSPDSAGCSGHEDRRPPGCSTMTQAPSRQQRYPHPPPSSLVGWLTVMARNGSRLRSETPREGLPGPTSCSVTWDAGACCLFKSGSVGGKKRARVRRG